MQLEEEKTNSKLLEPIQIDSRDSFENVSTKWISEINDNCPGVKVVLTALKCDLRKDEDENENPNAITFEQGLAKAKEIGAVKYLGRLFCIAVFLSRGICFLLANYTQLYARVLGRAKSRDQRNLLRGGKGYP